MISVALENQPAVKGEMVKLRSEARWRWVGRLWSDLVARACRAVSERDVLCSHTDTSTQSLHDEPRRSNEEWLEYVGYRGSTQPSHCKLSPHCLAPQTKLSVNGCNPD